MSDAHMDLIREDEFNRWVDCISEACGAELFDLAENMTRATQVIFLGKHRPSDSWVSQSLKIVDSLRAAASAKQGETESKNRGLYRKFKVTRTDGGHRAGRKHCSCRHFVLDLDCDKFARPAIAAYAEACKDEYPSLANDLRGYVKDGRLGALDCND